MIWNGVKERDGQENFEVRQDFYLFSIVYMPLRYAFRFHLFVLLTLQLEMSARVGIMDDAFDARELIEIQEFILLLVFRDQQKISRKQPCL